MTLTPRGRLLVEVLWPMSHLQCEDNARAAHDAVHEFLADKGYSIQREALMPYGVRLGRIDLVATDNAHGLPDIAVEIDRLSLRKKSRDKLLAWHDRNPKGIPVGVLRTDIRPRCDGPIEMIGLDVLFSQGVKVGI